MNTATQLAAVGAFHGFELETPGEEGWHYQISLRGSGAYDGLSATYVMVPQGESWDIKGIVFPGELPASSETS